MAKRKKSSSKKLAAENKKLKEKIRKLEKKQKEERLEKDLQKEFERELQKQIKAEQRKKDKEEGLVKQLEKDLERQYIKQEKTVSKKGIYKEKLDDFIGTKKEPEISLEEQLLEDITDIIIPETRGEIDYTTIKPSDLTFEGKKISDRFNELIIDAAQASGKHPQDILDNPLYKERLENLRDFNQSTTFKTIPSLINYLYNEKETLNITVERDGERFIEDKEEVINQLIHIEQDYRQKSDVVYIGVKIIHRLDGTIIIYLPNEDYTEEELEEWLNSDDAEYLIYEETAG